MCSYINEEIPIEDDPVEEAYTVGDYTSDILQTIKVRYVNSSYEQILFMARPSCKHKIQPQWSGIKCVVCNGWYCT